MKKINHNSLCETETHKVGMADSEIIKALECCKENSDCENCRSCTGYVSYGSHCLENIIEEALVLINRQKAEKEAMLSHIKCLQYENDKLRTRNDELNALNKTASQEAIKEFDERFKETATEITEVKENAFKGCYVISKANLYNLVKEMTEQRKDDEG